MNNELAIAVAKCIRKARQAQGMSQEGLASKALLDRTYISGVERGARNITLNSLEKIIIGLNISLDAFFIQVLKEIKNED